MTKYFTLLLLAILISATTLTAQDNNENEHDKVTFGMKVGVNSSNVWDEKGQDFKADAKMGFAGGIFLGIPIGDFLGIQPEVLISQKGFQGSGTLLGSHYSYTHTTTYVDFPLQLQLKPLSVLTLVGGPQYSYLFHQKDVYTFGANSTSQEQEFKNDNIRKNILGVVLGADIILSPLVISGRIGWDLQANNGNGTSYTPRYKNQWLQFTLGFRM